MPSKKKNDGRKALILTGWQPRNLTWEKQAPAARFITAARAGLSQRKACEFAGISTTTYQNWTARGTEHAVALGYEPNGIDYSEIDIKAQPADHRPYLAFLVQTSGAKAQLEARLVAELNQAVKGDWRGIKYMLSRINPDAWAEEKKVAFTGEIDNHMSTSPVVEQALTALIDQNTRDLEELASNE